MCTARSFVVHADKLLLHISKSPRFAFQVIAAQGTRNFDGTEHYVRLTAAFGVETVFWAPPRDRIVPMRRNMLSPHCSEGATLESV
jgi:hypothetical protein